MAITKSIQWSGITLPEAYAKITSRELSDFVEDGVKKYKCTYRVNVYTSAEKMGDVKQESFTFVDGESTGIAECYTDLKTREEFADWVDV